MQKNKITKISKYLKISVFFRVFIYNKRKYYNNIIILSITIYYSFLNNLSFNESIAVFQRLESPLQSV